MDDESTTSSGLIHRICLKHQFLDFRPIDHQGFQRFDETISIANLLIFLMFFKKHSLKNKICFDILNWQELRLHWFA